MKHDSRCKSPDKSEQKILDDVASYGWHVMKVLDSEDSPGWAYTIGLQKNFNHPQIIMFGLDHDVMHAILNDAGEQIRSGDVFATDRKYPNLIENYSCVFKRVKPDWYDPFLGFASWFYDEVDYSVLQCFWPDNTGAYPWDRDFSPALKGNQPWLF